MFKNFIAYRIAPLWPADLGAIEQALTKGQFTPCGATQESSIGFVPPRGEENGAMVESIAGQWILRFKSETKSIPAQALARRVAEKAARIEQETGRKPGKKERKELKDAALLSLAPRAFPRTAVVTCYYERGTQYLIVPTTSKKLSDAITSALVHAVASMKTTTIPDGGLPCGH